MRRMVKYEKIVINGKPLYREFCLDTGYYTDVLTEEELMQQLYDKAVHSVTEFHEHEIERALMQLDPYHKNILETYISYLERVVESLEKAKNDKKEPLIAYSL